MSCQALQACVYGGPEGPHCDCAGSAPSPGTAASSAFVTGPGRPVPIVRSSTVHDRHDLARRAGEERFVGSEQVVVSQDLLANLDARVGADLEEELARDPGQQAGVERRRERGAVLHDEEIRGRALGKLAAVVPHHALERAAADRLLHRQRVVQQVVRLDQRVDRVRVVPDDRHERHLDACFVDRRLADRPAA